MFRIDGETFSQLPWSLQSHGAVGKGPGWSYLMELTFSSLGGMLDMAVLPRDRKSVSGKTDLCPSQAREFPSGLPDFDTVYEVLAATPQLTASPLSSGLAKRFVTWPGDTVAPQSVLAWRDPAGCHLRVHLPKMPNWSTIEYCSCWERTSAQVSPHRCSPGRRQAVGRIRSGTAKNKKSVSLRRRHSEE